MKQSGETSNAGKKAHKGQDITRVSDAPLLPDASIRHAPFVPPALQTQTVLTCPHCRWQQPMVMPIHAHIYQYECPHCQLLLLPRQEDCCIFCAFADALCPAAQQRAAQRKESNK